MTRTYTFNSASLGGPWAIGFENFVDKLITIEAANKGPNYPPYNIIKHGPEHWSIELAVAGFNRDEIDIELAEGVLSISGKTEKENLEYVHQGIGMRNFTKKFTLADDVIVTGASMADGILQVNLERIVPEEKKARKIEIK